MTKKWNETIRNKRQDFEWQIKYTLHYLGACQLCALSEIVMSKLIWMKPNEICLLRTESWEHCPG